MNLTSLLLSGSSTPSQEVTSASPSEEAEGKPAVAAPLVASLNSEEEEEEEEEMEVKTSPVEGQAKKKRKRNKKKKKKKAATPIVA